MLPVLLAGCGEEACRDRNVEAKRDLDGPMVAWRFIRDCGPGTETVTHVAIGPADKGLKRAAAVFAADTNKGAAIRDGNALWIELRWTAPHRLFIAYGERARVLRSDSEAMDVKITYRATSGPVFVGAPYPIGYGDRFVRH